jgi:hypothetical protein
VGRRLRSFVVQKQDGGKIHVSLGKAGAIFTACSNSGRAAFG